jgi:hypothetical protein
LTYLLRTIGVFILWNLAVGVFILFADPLVALPISLALTGLLVWGFLLRARGGRQPERRWATLRLRPVRGPTLGWSIAAIPVFLVFSWAMGDVYTQIVPVPPESLNPFQAILGTAEGRLLLTIFAVAVAPIVEEFVFRGLLQRHMERRFGTLVGITSAAALFAIVHLLPWVLPLHFLLGIAFGVAVWAARSIWTGVLLHAANNSAAMIGAAFMGPESADTGTIWGTGPTMDLWSSVIILVVATLAAAGIARKLYITGRNRGLRSV